MPILSAPRARVVCAAMLLFSAGCSREPPPQPHVVLIVLDALRARNLGSYGYTHSTSPAIDQLAREGVLFENAISVGGNTTTAMPAIFTGQYAHFGYGVPWGEAPFGMDRFPRRPGTVGLPDSMTTLAEFLSAGGYRTAGFVTNPYLKSTFHMDQGFEHYEEVFNETGVPFGQADQVVPRALRYLEGVDWDQPTFLYVHFMDTHGPYRKPAPGLRGPAENSPKTFYERFQAWESLTGVAREDHESDWQYMMAAYDTSVRHADRFLGRVLQFFRDRALDDRTVFFVTADHGEEFLEHGGTTHKGTLFEELIHVPLVVRVPGVRGGQTVRKLVRSFDITPTILDYAGLGAKTEGMEAKSLCGLIEGRPVAERRTVYASFPHLRMMRTDRFKLLRYSDGRESLFDLGADPGETRDLTELAPEDEDSRRQLAAMQTLLDETVRRLEAQGAGSGAGDAGNVDEETRDQLRALGYIE